MDEHEQRHAAYLEQVRAKYDADQLKALKAKGHTLPGTTSYPIDDQDDLEKAIEAVGRGNADHDAIRKYIIGRAKAMGLSKLVPDNWNADGSLKQANMARTPLSRRRKPRHRAVPLMPEVRHWAAHGIEVRSAADGGDVIEITGQPIVYDQPYSVRDMFGEFTERMAPGVAANVLASGADCRFLFNHDGLPLARTTSGTLMLEDSPEALRFTARLDARQQLANDLAIAIERGDVSQMSCGFIVAEDKWDDAMENRTIFRFEDLLDVSPVTYPASPTTSIQIAQRMALEVPVESRARLRKLTVDLRAGKVLSQGNQDKLVAAAKTLHEVLDNAGYDPQDLIGDEDFKDEDTPDETLDASGEDGSGDDGGADEDNGASGVYADGSGARSDDPGESMRAVKLARLRVQMEARKRRRISV